MMRYLVLCVVLYLILAVVDEKYKDKSDAPTIHRNRMFKFAIYQDLLVALSILKMMVFEGYTLCGVVERIRSSGPMTHLYLATSVVLHGALLFDETTNHRLRLSPAPYLPDLLEKGKKDLLLM